MDKEAHGVGPAATRLAAPSRIGARGRTRSEPTVGGCIFRRFHWMRERRFVCSSPRKMATGKSLPPLAILSVPSAKEVDAGGSIRLCRQGSRPFARPLASGILVTSCVPGRLGPAWPAAFVAARDLGWLGAIETDTGRRLPSLAWALAGRMSGGDYDVDKDRGISIRITLCTLETALRVQKYRLKQASRLHRTARSLLWGEGCVRVTMWGGRSPVSGCDWLRIWLGGSA